MASIHFAVSVVPPPIPGSCLRAPPARSFFAISAIFAVNYGRHRVPRPRVPPRPFLSFFPFFPFPLPSHFLAQTPHSPRSSCHPPIRPPPEHPCRTCHCPSVSVRLCPKLSLSQGAGVPETRKSFGCGQRPPQALVVKTTASIPLLLSPIHPVNLVDPVFCSEASEISVATLPVFPLVVSVKLSPVKHARQQGLTPRCERGWPLSSTSCRQRRRSGR